MTTEEKTKGLEHLFRKCPDVITALEASRLIHVSKNSIHAAINEGKRLCIPRQAADQQSRLYRLPRRHHRRRNRMAKAAAGEDEP